MPAPKSPLWDHFLTGSKQNSAHLRAHCRGCIEQQCPDRTTLELDKDGIPKLDVADFWVLDAMKSDVGGVLGVKESMIAHILGKGGQAGCQNASPEARTLAKELKAKAQERKGGKRKRVREEHSSDADDEDEDEDEPPKKQAKLYQSIDTPFTGEQAEFIRGQFLRATISANLPSGWVEDPEVVKLFHFLRPMAGEVMPSRRQLKRSRRRLNTASEAETRS